MSKLKSNKTMEDIIGKTVVLIYMNDKQAPEPGTKGIVKNVDDMGTIHVNWENGSSLGLISGEDKYAII